MTGIQLSLGRPLHTSSEPPCLALEVYESIKNLSFFPHPRKCYCVTLWDLWNFLGVEGAIYEIGTIPKLDNCTISLQPLLMTDFERISLFHLLCVCHVCPLSLYFMLGIKKKSLEQRPSLSLSCKNIQSKGRKEEYAIKEVFSWNHLLNRYMGMNPKSIIYSFVHFIYIKMYPPHYLAARFFPFMLNIWEWFYGSIRSQLRWLCHAQFKHITESYFFWCRSKDKGKELASGSHVIGTACKWEQSLVPLHDTHLDGARVLWPKVPLLP